MSTKNRNIIISFISFLMITALTACNVDFDIPYEVNTSDNGFEVSVGTDFSIGDDMFGDGYFAEADDDEEYWDGVSEDDYSEDDYNSDVDWNEASSEDINPETTIGEGEDALEDFYEEDAYTLTFRNDKLLNDHFEKHGIEMGFASAEEYELAAAKVVSNPEALHKTEKEDGDDVYYIESTNEFVVVSTDGYIRTYFLPDSGIKYYEKQ